ncbi:cation:proton antiporter [Zobellella taiwanensis]|jgi:CPA1 family monovalent cation:H+ antiporter|uniref:Sodium:proton antiporter n=1 Tax=Zobellella taiwanensis TaxID=347535 RepID=A0A2P7QQ74_9GAMM|nr:sodium:proton antiporter [Zobellella taiwanensis]PSJ40108.1 sodium:proton antiporter [Zobellella taiwanensis]
MSVYYTLCFLAAMAISIAFVNQYIMKIQTTIAITSGALAISILMLILGKTTWPELQEHAVEVVKTVDFGEFLLQGILGFLLFAGGLGINLPALKSQKWEISVLVIVGVLISTLVVAAGLWLLAYVAAIPLPFIYCLLFGALISPTDPIAVLAIVKKLGAPEQIAIQIEGESLFNDGIGLVAFLTIFAVAFSGNEASFGSVLTLFTHEAIGGIIFGALLGLMSHIMISATDDGSMELLMTLCVPTAGFALANVLGVSGALAMVVAGIITGNWTRYTGFSEQSQKYLDHFWHLLDEFLNALLFLLIGLAMLLVEFHWQAWILVLLSIPLTLAGRFVSVALPYVGFRRLRSYNKYSVRILTWGGLRGGLSLAMALSIPAGIKLGSSGQVELRDLILMMTYAIVIFSIIVQGMTITPMINKAKAAEKAGFPIE